MLWAQTAGGHPAGLEVSPGVFTQLKQQRDPAPGPQDNSNPSANWDWALSASGLPPTSGFCSRSLVCDGKRGLLTRLLQVMKKEPAESSFRWV